VIWRVFAGCLFYEGQSNQSLIDSGLLQNFGSYLVRVYDLEM
jgi:hypothetical protein